MNQALLQQLAKLFPQKQSEIQQAVTQASQAIQGANESQAGEIAKNFGITADGINQLYSRYGNHPLASTLLGMVGTSPDRLRQDALNIISTPNSSNVVPSQTGKAAPPKRFPRLK